LGGIDVSALENLPDPLSGLSLSEFGSRYRAGTITSESVTVAYLERISVLNPRLLAFEYVAAESARATARALDKLLAAGIDLGPLMGVPIGVKDLFVVDSMPTTAGSRLDISDLLGEQGSFVTKLRRAGCVILGKTKTVEFAFGAVGTSSARGTPHNPWDSQVERAPGGSSSGSAVAVAAGLCAFAVGSDTGGSIRLPAAFCGVFGLKTTVGLWATDGVFPLSPMLDSIGLLARSAADATEIFQVIERTSSTPIAPSDLKVLRLGRPKAYLTDDLDADVANCMNAAAAALVAHGVTLMGREMNYVREREGFFSAVLSSELIATLGRDRFLRSRHLMDPVVAARTDVALGVNAADYVKLVRRHHSLKALAVRDMEGLDAWLTPTAALVPVALSDFADPARGLSLAGTITRNSQPMNLFGQCGTSTPIQMFGSPLPVALQITCRPFEERRALEIALAIENIVGRPPSPDLSAFLN
jgi:aspartyl-tRNA(Asn)/glutamyl-tRNA(Gln) amidotransferase subunit A